MPAVSDTARRAARAPSPDLAR